MELLAVAGVHIELTECVPHVDGCGIVGLLGQLEAAAAVGGLQESLLKVPRSGGADERECRVVSQNSMASRVLITNMQLV